VFLVESWVDHLRQLGYRVEKLPGGAASNVDNCRFADFLRIKPQAVTLERRGQTEAAVDLAGLAGLYPAGVICEIVKDDGTTARVPDLAQRPDTSGSQRTGLTRAARPWGRLPLIQW
jgi:3,4-dihydroxy-2-butanone 4-phosphate synthase